MASLLLCSDVASDGVAPDDADPSSEGVLAEPDMSYQTAMINNYTQERWSDGILDRMGGETTEWPSDATMRRSDPVNDLTHIERTSGGML